ncbi:hypothetical protein [Paracoccus mutanolyticus]|nr:hypothetical protein [Paracoccus mutanolyticus]
MEFAALRPFASVYRRILDEAIEVVARPLELNDEPGARQETRFCASAATGQRACRRTLALLLIERRKMSPT